MYKIITPLYFSMKRNLATAKCQAILMIHAARENNVSESDQTAEIYEVNDKTFEKKLASKLFVKHRAIFITDADEHVIKTIKIL